MGLRLARARQQKAFHTGPSYGAVSRKISCFGMDHHRAADCRGRVQRACVPGACVRAGCVRGACVVRAVRARRPPSETRRRVCHVSSGDQHRSSKKDSSVGEAGCGLCEYGRAGCVRCGEASVKARYLHGVSARHRSWYESGSSSASNRGGAGRCMGGAWAVHGRCMGGAGRGRWAGTTFRNARRCVLHVHARGTAPCQGRSLACSGRRWVDTGA